MHPMNRMFEELNRDYWGIPSSAERARKLQAPSLRTRAAKLVDLRR